MLYKIVKEKVKDILKDSIGVQGIGLISIDEIVVNIDSDFVDFAKIPSEIDGIKINFKVVGKIQKRFRSE